MPDILTTIDIISKAGFTGLLIVLAFPKLKKKVFENGNGFSEQLNKHTEEDKENFSGIKSVVENIRDNHLHEIKGDIQGLKTDVAYIRGVLDSKK